MGLYGAEELAYDLANAVEVARPPCSLHNIVDSGIGEVACVGLGIHFVDTGCKDDARSFGFEEAEVGFEVARIRIKVGGVVELCGVNEVADHRNVGFGHTAAHKRGMALVKCAHRRDEPYGFARFARGIELVAQLGYCFDDEHGSSFGLPCKSSVEREVKREE